LLCNEPRRCCRPDWTKHVVGIHWKTFPLQALTGPEGSRRLRPPDFKTVGT
jgi:hypothetical protein